MIIFVCSLIKETHISNHELQLSSTLYIFHFPFLSYFNPLLSKIHLSFLPPHNVETLTIQKKKKKRNISNETFNIIRLIFFLVNRWIVNFKRYLISIDLKSFMFQGPFPLLFMVQNEKKIDDADENVETWAMNHRDIIENSRKLVIEWWDSYDKTSRIRSMITIHEGIRFFFEETRLRIVDMKIFNSQKISFGLGLNS